MVLPFTLPCNLNKIIQLHALPPDATEPNESSMDMTDNYGAASRYLVLIFRSSIHLFANQVIISLDFVVDTAVLKSYNQQFLNGYP